MTDRPTTDSANHHAEAWVPIRTLAVRHRVEILAHLLALAPQDRYLRFGYAATDSHIERYVDGLNFERDEVFGIIDRSLRLIAVGHLACAYPADLPMSKCHLVTSLIPLGGRTTDVGLGAISGQNSSAGRTMAEFGGSVLPHAQGRGYGTRLFGHAMLHARNRGLNTLYIHALSENTAMLHIARRAGAAIERSGGESDAYLRLPEGTLGSHAEALWGDSAAAFDHLLKQTSHRSDALAGVGHGGTKDGAADGAGTGQR